jgi:hypothetical protein
MIQENQKKTTSEWNALIRAALMEIDQHIGEASISERNAVLTFEEYRDKLQNLGAMKGFDMERIDSSTSDNSKTRTTSIGQRVSAVEVRSRWLKSKSSARSTSARVISSESKRHFARAVA